MKHVTRILFFAGVILAVLLAACAPQGSRESQDATPTAEVAVPTGAPTEAPTTTPLAPTAVGTVTMLPSLFTPTGAPSEIPTATGLPPETATPIVVPQGSTQTAAPANSCPVARWINSGSNITVIFEAGKSYHVNLSENGQPAGVEANAFFTAKVTFTMQFDGSVWEYPGLVTDGQCQLCSETVGDHWVEDIPELVGLVEYHTPPCAGQPVVPSGDLFIKSVTQ